MGAIMPTKLTPERIALLKHPLFLIKLNLKFAWNSLDSIRWALASGNARSACESLSGVRARLDDCEEMIINNVLSVPDNFLKWFFKKSTAIRVQIHFWAHGGIAEGLASFRRALKMVITI